MINFFRVNAWVVLGCAVLVSAGNLRAVGPVGNAYVQVTAVNKTVYSDPSRGVGSIVLVNEEKDFHITTCHVEDSFVAKVTIEAKGHFTFKTGEKTKIIDMTVGDITGWSVHNPETNEDNQSGEIILFKVDVEIDGVGEEEEEIKGAFVDYASCAKGYDAPSCYRHFKRVSIRCLPSNRPDNELLNLTFSEGFLLVAQNGVITPANKSYKVNEIAGKQFRLHGHAPSKTMRDRSIEATHSINACTDKANYTVIKCAFTAFAKAPATPDGSFVTIVYGTDPRDTANWDWGHACWKISVEPEGLFNEPDKIPPYLAEFANVPMGFYPANSDFQAEIDLRKRIIVNWVDGEIINPDPKVGEYSYEWVINLSQAENGLKEAKRLSDPEQPLYYHPFYLNCVDAVVEMGRKVGVTVPNPREKVQAPPPHSRYWTPEISSAGLLAQELDKLNKASPN